MKDGDKQPLEHAHTHTRGHVFLSTIPSCEAVHCEHLQSGCDGWAQLFVFTSKDRAHHWDEQGDDEPILDLISELLEVVSRSALWTHRAGTRSC